MCGRRVSVLVVPAVIFACFVSGRTAARSQEPPPVQKGESTDPPTPRDDVGEEILRIESMRETRDNLDAAGLPADGTPFVLNLRQAYELALIKARSPSPIWTGPEAKPFDAEGLKKASEEYGVSDFKRFRDDFLGDPNGERKAGGFRDPSATFFDVLTLRAHVDSNREQIRTYESMHRAYTQFATGVSDISMLNVKRIESVIQRRRRTHSRLVLRYRGALDDLKAELGLRLDLPVLVDDSAVAGFRESFRRFDEWLKDEDRDPDDLPRLAEGFPALPAIRIDEVTLGEAARDNNKLQRVFRVATKLAAKGSESPERAEILARRRVRSLLGFRENYPFETQDYRNDIMIIDSLFRRVFAPPGTNAAREVEYLTTELTKAQSEIAAQQQRLISLWADYQVDRIALARLLHQMPGEDWDSFLAPFTAKAKAVEAPGEGGEK